MSKLENLRLEVEERVALLTVNRPEVLNALNLAVLQELESALLQLTEDDEVAAVILTGEGEKAFVAGADIKQLAELEAMSAREFSAYGQSVFRLVESCPKPVMAAVNGFCLGGGCELALACHIRVASSRATFGQPEVKLGVIPGYGGTQRLSRLVGKGKAMELVLSGEMISADEALRIGLVNRVVDPHELLSTSRDLAGRIAANGPLAVRLAIQAINDGAEVPLEQALSMEAGLFGLACSTEDMREGTRAFLEKRKPEFSGR